MAAIERKALIVTDRFLDLVEVLTAAGLVHRVGTVVTDQETPAARARVLNADPAAGDYGLVVRVVPSAGGGSSVDVTDRDARLLGRAKILDSAGAVIDPALKGQLPAALVGGRLDVNLGALTGGLLFDVADRDARLAGRVKLLDSAGAVIDAALKGQLPATLGQKTMALALAVSIASDQSAIPISAAVGAPAFVRLSDGAAALVGQKTMAASVPVVLASDQTVLPAVAEQRAATLHVTGTAAVNTALTITLPAAGAGLFHYITSIQWFKKYNVIGVAGAGPIITSTNLPGNPAWDTEHLAAPANTVIRVIDYQAHGPLRSAVANTATTIVAPLQLQTIWRGNVSYFIAP
jgi:hypothetical protein